MTSTYVAAGAYDAFVTGALPRSRAQRGWTPDDGPLPSVYVSHGAPPLLDDAAWIDDLFGWSQTLPKPTAILVVSAHWESAPLALSTPTAATTPVYDFGGFDPRFSTLRYDTPDAGPLARRVAALMPDSEPVHQHPSRGLDHGAWIPLMVMYPAADVPVLQMSLPTHDPDRLLALGARLRPLREQGVLVVGSGFMTHGLPFLTREMWRGEVVPSWSRDFDAWAADALARGDVDQLTDYRAQAPGMPYAHPTVEHFTPLFVTLGAAADPEAPSRTTIDGYRMGLSRRSFEAA
ncbi:MAG: class III extradiol ring-cleavage dioxygenase [Actinomycetota bacterium]